MYSNHFTKFKSIFPMTILNLMYLTGTLPHYGHCLNVVKTIYSEVSSYIFKETSLQIQTF